MTRDDSVGAWRVRKTLICAAMLVMLVCVAPGAAAAATGAGGLEQLSAPNDCVSSNAGSNCGTIVAGGLGAARSVAVTPDGASAYVASTTGALSTFGRNATTGALSFTSCIKDPASTEPCPSNTNRPLDGAAWVVANDGFVYVAAPNADAISAFQRNSDTGQLTAIGCIRQGGGNPAGGPACASSPGLTGVDRIALSADGKNLYAISPAGSTLATLNINSGTGLLSAGGCVRGTTSSDVSCGTTPVPGLGGANGVAVAPDGKTVHVTATSGGTSNVSYLTSFTRNTSTGALTQSECFHSSGAQGSPDTAAPPCTLNPTPVDGLNGADGVVVSPDNKNVYVASGASGPNQGNSLITFDRDTASGALSNDRCLHDAAASLENCGSGTTAVGLKGGFDLALTPNGKFLYVTARTGNDVAEFARNTGTGGLAQLAGSDKCISRSGSGTECAPNNTAKGLQGASDITVSPDGLYAYVGAPGDSALSEFRIEAPPVCSNFGPLTTPHDQAVPITLPCADPNPGEAITCVTSDPANGTVTPDSPGSCSVTYTPDPGFSGMDSFTYHATDAAGQDSNTATANITVAAASTPAVTVSDAAASESDGTITFQLTLSAPFPNPVDVDYVTHNGSAVAPSDYTASAGQAHFAANQTTSSITVPIVNDTIDETTEDFTVELTSTTGGTAIARPLATGTIGDDDTSSIGIGDVTVNENAGTASFTVTLSTASSRTVTANWVTANGSATAPTDYTAQTGRTISFAPGETSKQVVVPIVDDTTPEQTEQFSVTLANPSSGAVLGKATGVGTIDDNDVPTVSVSDAAVVEGNAGTRNAEFTVSLSGAISRSVSVNATTLDGSASTADGDYTATSAGFTFAAGETSKTISVPVVGDTKPEGDETFTLHLQTATNATIADGDGTGTILDDDTVATQGGLSVSDAALAEGNSGKRAASFTVSLSQAAGAPVTVDFATSDGTAKAASDYDSSTGTLTFAPGDTSKTVTVPVNGDTAFEPDESFTLTLSNASGAPISRAAGTGTIVNDDAAPIKRRKPGVKFSLRPSRDRTAPFRYKVSGSIVRPKGVSRAKGCGAGNVRVSYVSGGKTISRDLAGVDSRCKFRLTTVFDDARRIKRGKLVVKVRFLGNRYLLPANARSRKARAG
jgi:sugar lactone lactonase YvrE